MDDLEYPTDPNESIEDKAVRISKRILSGCPVKYRPDYHIPMLISLFTLGNDIACFCSAAEVSRKTFDNWVNSFPDFNEAYETGLEMANLFWEKYADTHGDSPDFNTKLWSIKMRNRFGYTDQRKLKIKALKNAKNAKEQMDCIVEEISEGRLTGSETNQLGSFIKTAIDVDTHIEVKKDIKALQERLGVQQ